MKKEAYYFSHPQPSSPNTRAEPKEIGGRLICVDKKKGRLKGVGSTHTIYYLWFEYFKRSNDYKIACANNGKGVEKIFREFATYEDVMSRKSGIDDYEILLLPKSMPKTEMHERVGKLITSIKEDEVKLHE